MASFNNNSYSRPETKAERRERQRETARRARAAVAGSSDERKIELLGAAIADAFVKRGNVSVHDLTQAGFAEADAKRFYDRAVAHAQVVEPAMIGSAA